MGNLVFPWIPEIASRLVSSKFNRHFLIEVSTYLSCVGLLQNHWFVNFRKLHTLHTSIHAECNNVQQLLKRKKILSEHTISSVITFKAHRLHKAFLLPFRNQLNHAKPKKRMNYYRLMNKQQNS